MIKPINGHILIKPLTHEGFTASQQESYQEIGTVIAFANDLTRTFLFEDSFKIGDKVYFDSWLAAKFPSDDPENPYWLVKYEDLRAYEDVKSE